MCRTTVLLAIALLTIAPTCFCQALQLARNLWTSETPTPGGPNQIGTFSFRLVDATRSDPYLPKGGRRELIVRFWYPALAQPCHPAEYTTAKVWTYLSRIYESPLPAVKTHSCLNANAAEGVYPVVLFTHGYTGTLTDATFLFEDLASRGFIVASIGHTHETTAIEFPDGRLIPSLVGSYLAGDMNLDYATLQRALSVRLADVSFVLRELQQSNVTAETPLAGKLDPGHIGVMGHSLGGDVAFSILERDSRIQAAVALDGMLLSAAAVGTNKPVLLLTASREHWTPEECQLWSAMHGPHIAVNLQGADHFTPTDAIWVFRSLPGFAASVGPMGRATTISAIRSYVAEFFEISLRGSGHPGLFNASAYPDAIVINQSQAMCHSNPKIAKGESH